VFLANSGYMELEQESHHDLIVRWRAGDDRALQDLLPLVYQELRAIARRHMNRERENHTLQATALIHEVYARLAGAGAAEVHDRQHFVALASRLMRQVLIDHARGRLASKRDGGIMVTLGEAENAVDSPGVDVLALDDALTRLATFDPQQARVVELRFFGGLSIPETAEALGISTATVSREWTTVRGWLYRELRSAQ